MMFKPTSSHPPPSQLRRVSSPGVSLILEVVMQNRIDRRVGSIVALAVALVALAGAAVGTSATKKEPPPSPIKGIVNGLKGLSPAAREQKLYTAAKSEGTVNWYTTLSRTIGPAVRSEEHTS